MTEDLEKRVVTLLESYDATVQQRFTQLEAQLETLERLIALLTQSYAEVATMVESLVSSIVNSSPQQREDFYTALKQSRSNMIDILRQHGQPSSTNEDKFVATADQSNR